MSFGGHSPKTLNNSRKPINEYFTSTTNPALKRRKPADSPASNMGESDDEGTMMDMLKKIRRDTKAIRNDINDRFAESNAKFDIIDAKIDSVVDNVSILQTQMNEVQQEKLSQYMDVTGLSEDEVQLCQNDARACLSNIMLNFGINLNPQSVRTAFLRETKSFHKFVLTVVFSTLDDKISVMKKKREYKGGSSIYFNHAMTPATRKLLNAARQKAKDLGTSAFLRSGKVFIAGADSKLHRILNESDLAKFVSHAADQSLLMQ